SEVPGSVSVNRSSKVENPIQKMDEPNGREYAKVTFSYVAKHEDELSLKDHNITRLLRYCRTPRN
ncbi:hypothetical protein PENTCL1PPCAC_21715, partial [Pristionchus entomophagus]